MKFWNHSFKIFICRCLFTYTEYASTTCSYNLVIDIIIINNPTGGTTELAWNDCIQRVWIYSRNIYIFLINKVEIFLHLHRKPHENNHCILFVVHTLVSETYTLWEINREIPVICAVNHETIIKIEENWEFYSLKFLNANCRLAIV